MKTLILKELRENLKLAVVGLLLSLAVVVGSQLYYVNLIKGITSGVSAAQNYYYRLQPLTSNNFTSFSMILCVLVGAALGWFQIQNERHRDLWAFLVHRPVTRTTIFLSKVIAGLTLYVLTVGLPLLYFILWVKTPGNVAAPFDWGMALPIMAAFLSGVAWYFAGMLTSIRQARWYGSRALGFGAALLALLALMKNGHGVMSWWFGVILIVALAMAVWGAFQSHGRFQGQPVLGKAALTLSLTPGAGLVFVAIIALGLEIYLGLYGVTIWPRYAMGRDGVVYKVIESNKTPQILSLDGQLLKDPETGSPMELDKFNRTFSLGTVATAWGKRFGPGQQSEGFNLFAANRHILWFNLNLKRSGRIEAYDVRTRKFIESIGPDGFAANKEGDGSKFLANNRPQIIGLYDDTTQPMASTNTVYEIDLENRAVKPLWTVAGDDTIESVGRNFKGRSAVVMTRHAIVYLYLATNVSNPMWSIPFDYSYKDYSTVNIYQLIKAGESVFSVWIAPPFSTSPNLEGDAKLPTHVLWLSGNGEITKSEDLPPLEQHGNPEISSRILNAFMPPVVQLLPPWLSDSPIQQKMDWHDIRISFGLGLVCALAGWRLGRRYSFTAKRHAIWALFNLFFGIPGLLAFISVQEWPTRERCDNCGKLRVVNNERCEHCGAGFPASKKNGTEIFEAVELCER